MRINNPKLDGIEMGADGPSRGQQEVAEAQRAIDRGAGAEKMWPEPRSGGTNST
jgi:hypothetical protein